MSNEVEVLKWERTKEPGKSYFERVFDYNAIFCEWGCDYEEFESGPGNFSTVIVRKINGQLENVPVQLVKFKYNEGLLITTDDVV